MPFEDIDLADVWFAYHHNPNTWMTDKLTISWTNGDGSNQHLDIDTRSGCTCIEAFEFADGSVFYDDITQYIDDWA